MFEPRKALLLLALAVIGVASRFSGELNPYYYHVILTIGINMVLAVSLNLVNGYTGQFSLGHAGFMSVGAYTAAAITTFAGGWALALLKPLGAFASNTVFFGAALVLGGLAAGLAGIFVGVPSLRLKGDYLAIVTLGFGEIIRVVIQNVDALGGARGLNGLGSYTNLFWVYGVVAVLVYVVLNLVQSTYGRGFLAVRDDEIAAESMGINTTKYKVLAFSVAAFFAGVAGGLYAHFTQFIDPEGFNFLRSVEIVTMVILGGMGSTWGVMIAAVVVTILPEYLRTVSHYKFLPIALRHMAENRMIFYSLLLIILMLTRPQGLFGGTVPKRKEKV